MASKERAAAVMAGGLDAHGAFAWALNISSALCIIFVNKHLMGSDGLGFRFATSLTALHFLVSAAFLMSTRGSATKPPAQVAAADLLLFTVVANVSIIGLNLSLMLNTVGFYQITKLLIAPFVCAVEILWLGRHFPPPMLAAVALVVVSVGFVTVSGPTAVSGIAGLASAAAAVAGTGVQQILVRHLQQKYSCSSSDLLGQTAPLQGASLLLIGPLLDRYIGGAWVTGYAYTWAAGGWLLLSCLSAVAVNLSQYMVLGRFSASTYSVVGHVKTVLVLGGGWLLFREVLTMQQAVGMAAAVAGMIWYGFESEAQSARAKAAAESRPSGGGGPASPHGGGGVDAAEQQRLLGGDAARK